MNSSAKGSSQSSLWLPAPHSLVDEVPAYQQLRRGMFLSDLHLFSTRSMAVEITELVPYKRPDECIVLGGDIFDFKWSTLGGLNNSIEAALQWVQILLDITGDSQIIYLAGNHDCHPLFTRALQQIDRDSARFSFHEHAIHLGDCLFLHGDILDAGITQDGFINYRQKHHHVDPRHRALHHAYDLAVSMRLHNAVAKLHNTPKTTLSRLEQFVRSLEIGDQQPVRRIYFGHTHVAIPGKQMGELVFFNPGALLKYTNYAPMHFELNHRS